MGTPRHSNKQIWAYLCELRNKGWELIGGKKHYKIRSPKGKILSLSSSPSDGFALANIKRDVHRLEAMENEQTS